MVMRESTAQERTALRLSGRRATDADLWRHTRRGLFPSRTAIVGR
jgi:hypothetical protein